VYYSFLGNLILYFHPPNRILPDDNLTELVKTDLFFSFCIEEFSGLFEGCLEILTKHLKCAFNVIVVL